MPFAGVPNAKCCGKIRDLQRLLLTSVKHFFIDCILPDEEEWADWPIRFRDRNENPFLDMGAPFLSTIRSAETVIKRHHIILP